jgi:preprotein translocase subunit SecF
MDSGLWVLIVLIAGVFGLVGYFVVRESNTNTKKQSGYSTRQYQNSRKTVKENKWSEKLYYNKGVEDSKKYKETSEEELEIIIDKIKKQRR